MKTIKISEYAIKEIVIFQQEGEYMADITYIAKSDKGESTYQKTIRPNFTEKQLAGIVKLAIDNVQKHESNDV